MSVSAHRHCRAARSHWARRRLALVASALLFGAIPAGAQLPTLVPPSPYDILGTDHLKTPVIDAVPMCIGSEVSDEMKPVVEMARTGEMREAFKLLQRASERAEETPLEAEILAATFQARLADKRERRLLALERLGANPLRRARETERACIAVERARLYLFIGRYPEAVAQAVRIERMIPRLSGAQAFIDAARFFRAEVLFHTGQAFAAHLAFRELARTSDPRVAAAARLRVTDLSFDGGRADIVRVEYETLLPKAQVYGASIEGWALRAMEASLAAGDLDGAQAWLDRYLETVTDKALHDVVMIRQADLEVMQGESRSARSRLNLLAGRTVWSPVSELARVRLVALGLADGSEEKRKASLRWAVRSPAHGVALYALGVMTHQAVLENDLDEGLNAGTRLAYEGGTRILTPLFEKDLELLLSRARDAAVASDSDEGCLGYVRRIGGRYGILIQQTDQDDVFFRLALCMERLHLPQLAVKLYRAMTRTYGNRVAEYVALPLARASLAAGDHAMARAAARASLRYAGADEKAWRLLLAEAELIDGREQSARDQLREIVGQPGNPDDVVHALYLFATSLREEGGAPGDLDLLEKTAEAVPTEARHRPFGEFGRATAIAGELRRGRSEAERARALYGTAREYLPQGSRRAETIYWQSSLAPGAKQADRFLSQAAASELGGPWSRLASFELGFSELRRQYEGRP